MEDEKKVLPELQGVKYLLKFGEKEHIEQFIGGSLFCFNAETFWGIENDKKSKGRVIVLKEALDEQKLQSGKIK
ncbi:MAG: hypothetical protein LUC38_07915 [Oscillospiraceae bacterium]|nr:hypothetical protein [Ruminococcus sp.]MCD8345862.1 hypothetical protein [Oscillospiraceae bacterium]